MSPRPLKIFHIGCIDSQFRLKEPPNYRITAVLSGWNKLHRNRVDAVAGIGGSKSLADKNVAQVSAAIGALHFGTVAIRIGQVVDRPFDLFVEGRPATMGVEFVNRPVKFGVALSADVMTVFVKVIIFASEGPFRSFVFNNVPLFGVQGVVILVCHFVSLSLVSDRM